MSCSYFKWCPRCHSRNISNNSTNCVCFDCNFEWDYDDYYYDYRDRDYVYCGDDDDEYY